MLGYLAATLGLTVEDETGVDAIHALNMFFAGMGVPIDSATRYESAIMADGFLVVAHGSTKQVAHAQAILASVNPLFLGAHEVPRALTSSPAIPMRKVESPVE